MEALKALFITLRNWFKLRLFMGAIQNKRTDYWMWNIFKMEYWEPAQIDNNK